ncbi:hypothetical protein ES705_48609 [subsurface metagenome]
MSNIHFLFAKVSFKNGGKTFSNKDRELTNWKFLVIDKFLAICLFRKEVKVFDFIILTLRYSCEPFNRLLPISIRVDSLTSCDTKSTVTPEFPLGQNVLEIKSLTAILCSSDSIAHKGRQS